MASQGDVIENPLTGVRITFQQTTGDELLPFEYVLPPRFSIPEHLHPRRDERHEALSGTLRGRVEGREQDSRKGEHAVGPRAQSGEEGVLGVVRGARLRTSPLHQLPDPRLQLTFLADLGEDLHGPLEVRHGLFSLAGDV